MTKIHPEVSKYYSRIRKKALSKYSKKELSKMMKYVRNKYKENTPADSGEVAKESGKNG